MKKKRPQQKQTPPTKGLNILAVKRSAFPVEPPPNYLKAGKKDKLSVAKTKLAASKARQRSSLPVPDNNAAPKANGATHKPKPKN
jgi:hypothetical protein